MQTIWQYLKKRKLLLALSFIFFLVRLPFLDQLNLIHDERDIVLSGYSIAKTAHDLNGHFLPLAFENIHPKTPFLSIYFSAFWWLFLPKTIFWARFPFVLVTTAFMFLVYELVIIMTKNKKLSLISSIVFCFSPWIFHMTRLALEVNISYLLLLSGAILYLKRKRLWSYLFFFLSFYTYQAFRPLMLFVLLFLELYFFIQTKKWKNFLINNGLNFLFFIGLFVSSLFIDGNITKGRISEIIFFDTELLSQDVYFKRMTSIASPELQRITHNKLISSFDYILTNFTKGLDPSYLFKFGDPSAINGNISTGQFFAPMILFYFLGFTFLGGKDLIYFYPLGFILVGLIPSLINSHSATYSFRAALSSFGMTYIISCGVLYVKELVERLKPIYKNLLYLGFFGLIGINLYYFTYNYYFRRPVSVGELFFENERQLANYLIENNNRTITVYHSSPNEVHLTYTMLKPDVQSDNLRAYFDSTNDIVNGNVNFLNCNVHKDFKVGIKDTVIFEGCLGEKRYNTLAVNKSIKKIPYKDISRKFAYFIFE